MSEQTFHSGFIGVVGKPNVGKSTLINRLTGQKIAAVSPRPQTTQRNQLGILTTDQYQLIFIDTPGIHTPLSKLGESMNEAALETLKDADYFIWMTDASKAPDKEDGNVARKLKKGGLEQDVLIVLNKQDAVNEGAFAENCQKFMNLLPEADHISISSKTGKNCEDLLQKLIEKLPEGPAFYDPEQVTDLYEREIAADLIRESLLKNLDDEIPHSIAVRIDEYTDRSETNAYIQATLLLDRESHKGIVVGKNGDMIKKIGSDARREIESMTGRKIYLELRVKVMKNWKNDVNLLRSLGFA